MQSQEQDANTMRISVIIPCFNARQFVSDAILSCLQQPMDGVEIIVVDDGSTDGSYAWIQREFGDRVKVVQTENRGPSAARNVGLNMASAEYVKFLDADDWLAPGSLKRQIDKIAVLQPDEFVVGRSFRYEELSGDILPHSPRDRTFPSALSMQQLLLDVPLLGAPLHRRELLGQIRGCDEQLRYREDFDLFVRLLINGAKPVFTTEVAVFYRNHQSGERVSKQKPGKIALKQLKMFERHIALMEGGGGPHMPELAAAISLAIWQSGRNILRAGLRELAVDYFALARRCSPSKHVHGRLLYKALHSTLGPIRTEDLLSRAKGATFLRRAGVGS